MAYRADWKTLRSIKAEASHGADRTRLEVAKNRLDDVLEIMDQVGQDRRGLHHDHQALKRHWEEPILEDEEPHIDYIKASRERYWWIGAILMFLIEASWASWLTTTYIEIPAESPMLRMVILGAIGFVVTLVVTLLFSKALATLDDDLRPIPSLKYLGRRAAFFSIFGIVAVAAFLLTRQYVIGGLVLQISLAILTLCLAAGVAASSHCAQILRRPNRLARKYDQLDKLMGEAGKVKKQLEALRSPEGGSPPPPREPAVIQVHHGPFPVETPPDLGRRGERG